MKKLIIAVVALSFYFLFSTKNTSTKFETVNRSVQSYQAKDYVSKRNVFVEALLAKMTLDEKIGQLNLPTSGDFTTGQAQSSDIGKK
jgi:hypothetical protein